MNEEDKYLKLTAPGPTPLDEICACQDGKPIKLMSALGFNPIHCVACNLEVPPERLRLSADLVEKIAKWHNLYDAIDRLWLDSGFYETWAKDQLANVNSAVNVMGREVQRDLNTVARCYYWHFQDESEKDHEPFTLCPLCGATLTKDSSGVFEQRICEPCSIIGAGL